MSTPSVQQPDERPPAPSIIDPMELVKFLSEQSDANRRALNEQAEADRTLFKHILWIVTAPLTALILVAGWFGYNSITSLKQSIQEQARAEGKRAIEDASSQLATDLHNKVGEQFQTPRIKQTIHDAAVEATQNEAKPIIREAVNAQVGKAVASQSGQIESIAVKAVNEKVNTAIAPLASAATKTLDEMHVQQLIARVEADDARAFDQLVPLENGPSPNTMVMSVIQDRQLYYRQNRIHGGGHFERCLNPDSPDFRAELTSRDATERQNAIEDCTEWVGNEIPDPGLRNVDVVAIEEKLPPLFVAFALDDPSLAVRGQAIHGLNALFDGSPDFPQHGLDVLVLSDLNKWWPSHRQDYKVLEWVSRMRFRMNRPQNPVLDSAYLYGELQQVTDAAPDVADALRNTAMHLRQIDTQTYLISFNELKKALGRDTCTSVEADLEARIRSWEDIKDHPYYEQILDNYGTQEIAFLRSCPTDVRYVHTIADYASHSISLGKRYGAILTINAWLGTHFDPFNVTEFNSWWQANRQQYSN